MRAGGFRKYLDSIRPSFEEGGRLSWLHSFYEALDTTVSVPGTLTHSGSHIRDCIDLKRIMLCAVVSLLPCIVVSCFVNGFLPVLRLVITSLAVGYAVELVASQLRGKPLCEGYAVTGLIIPLIVPIDIPLWVLAIAVAFAVLVGKVAFGGGGMNIWNTALLAKAFIIFGFPTMAGSGAAPMPCGAAWLTAVGIGALILLVTGTASWKVMLPSIAGVLAAAGIAGVAMPGETLSAFGHLAAGNLIFGIVFMATDPVTCAQTEAGKWIYGFGIGVLVVLVRNLGLMDADGTMTAILIMNTLAPLIDRMVIAANINSRQRRNLTV